MAEPCRRIGSHQRTHKRYRQNHQKVAKSAEQRFALAARGHRPNHPGGEEVGLEHHCGDRAPEQKPAENQRAAVSAVPKIERRSRVEPRYISERLCGIWQDAHYIGSIRAQLGSAKIRLAALKSFLLNRMGDNAAHASRTPRWSLVYLQ